MYLSFIAFNGIHLFSSKVQCIIFISGFPKACITRTRWLVTLICKHFLFYFLTYWHVHQFVSPRTSKEADLQPRQKQVHFKSSLSCRYSPQFQLDAVQPRATSRSRSCTSSFNRIKISDIRGLEYSQQQHSHTRTKWCGTELQLQIYRCIQSCSIS